MTERPLPLRRSEEPAAGGTLVVWRRMRRQPPAQATEWLRAGDGSGDVKFYRFYKRLHVALGMSQWLRPPLRVGAPVWLKETWAPSIGSGNLQIAFRSDGRWGSPIGDGTFIWHGWVQGLADLKARGCWVGRNYFGPWKRAATLPPWMCRNWATLVSAEPEERADVWGWRYTFRAREAGKEE